MRDAGGVDREVKVDRPAPYLYDVVDQLWPGAEVLTGLRRGTRGERFVALPSPSAPAMLVPIASRRVAATALREAKTGGVPRQRRLFRLMSVAAQLGLVTWAPQRVTVLADPSQPSERVSLLAWLSAELGREIHASLPGSPARANRKPVLHLIGADGVTLGFAKVGTNALTRRLVADEGRALAGLADARPQGITVPELLFSGTWNGLEVMVQAPLLPAGPQGWSAVDLGARMAALATVRGVQTATLNTSPFVAGLADRIAALPQDPTAQALRTALEGVRGHRGATELAHGVWHGDWTAWNMARRGDQLLLWDWERYQSGVPLGFDALHHDMQTGVVRGGMDPRTAAEQVILRSAELLSPFAVPAEAARASALLYLIELGTRYSADDQRTAGGNMATFTDWLVPVLAGEGERLGHG